MFNLILSKFGFDPEQTGVSLIGEGLINKTYKLTSEGKSYILQEINDSVFKKPEDIDKNLNLLKKYLGESFPEYLFVSPIESVDGITLFKNEEGYFRLFNFIDNSVTLNVVKSKEEAYEAAKQFGKFSNLLAGFDAKQLAVTLPNFHNLALRFDQFIIAVENANEERLEKASTYIKYLKEHEYINETYLKIVKDNQLPLRVIHHDTKISNVLFDLNHKGLCVIDLDTVMPGYFISDIGDMMRTYLSPANEEETDFTKINVRADFFKAIYDGYMEEMGAALSETEKHYFIYAGKFIIYMQALRFLTDYLQNDQYYGARYEGHNLNRAINQITLLDKYLSEEAHLAKLIDVKKVFSVE